MTRDVAKRESLPPADEKFLENIERHGWVVTRVFRSGDETGPEFAYSTGLFLNYQHPEIIIFGLDLGNMHTIINNIGDMVKKGQRFESGKEYQDIFARCGCEFRDVDVSRYKAYLGWAIWFYESYQFPTLQCFWPDRRGLYPWSSTCSADVATLQPLLFKPA
jgi:hypothetical protein